MEPQLAPLAPAKDDMATNTSDIAHLLELLPDDTLAFG